MKNIYKKIIVGALGLLLIGSGVWYATYETTPELSAKAIRKLKKQKRKKARGEYFQMLLQDPKTKKIPANIRNRELAYARKLARDQSNRRIETTGYNWEEKGPNNVGGRTRALAFDKRNSNIVLAGGVSGGMWKSTDGGVSWSLKTDLNDNMSVTSIAQDPTVLDTWYYVGGEATSISVSGEGAFMLSEGLYKSTDNGETWVLQTYSSNDQFNYTLETSPDTTIATRVEGPFNKVEKIEIAPNGDIFIASNDWGVYRSSDDANSFQDITPNFASFTYSNIAINKNGWIVISGSELGNGTGGIFLSKNNGDNFSSITPSNFPQLHSRTVFAFSESSPEILYNFSVVKKVENGFIITPKTANGKDSDFRLYRYNLNNNTTENLSSNISSDFFSELTNRAPLVDTQSEYNIALAIHPNDPNLVVFGTTNLLRTRDGFKTPLNNATINWIGGYSNTQGPFETYPNHHPDIHTLVFDPNDPNTLWSGDDGGLHKTDITNDAIT